MVETKALVDTILLILKVVSTNPMTMYQIKLYFFWDRQDSDFVDAINEKDKPGFNLNDKTILMERNNVTQKS